MSEIVYPGDKWEHVSPSEAGFDAAKLDSARQYLDDHITDGRYRVVIVRGGRIVAEWNRDVDPNELIQMASATKSLFSCVLGIAIDEGKLPSADARIVDYYPEAMDVPEGEGPKPGRYVFEKDRAITFRQLISNTSGYMKPGEEPGQVFHYQTYGMNILTHALAKIYGLHDPHGSSGFDRLIDEKLREPIGGNWRYLVKNFQHPPQARVHIFGNYTDVMATVPDMARLGWLWRNWGRWGDQQVVPEAWLREATQTAPAICANSPEEQWKYGYGFWTNADGQLLPGLPRDSYAASGAGGIALIWVCPSLDLVVAHNPGLFLDQPDETLNTVPGFLRLVVEARSELERGN